MAAQDQLLADVRPNGQEDAPQFRIDIDRAEGERARTVDRPISTIRCRRPGAAATSTTSSTAVASSRSIVQARCPVPHAARGSRSLVSCATRRRDGAVSRPSRTRTGTFGSPRARALQRLPPSRSTGKPAPGTAPAQAMDGDGADSSRSCRPAIGYDWTGRPIEERAAGAQAAAALRAVADRGLPVPGRALRELVDPVRGDARGSAGHDRRGARHARCAVWSNDVYFQVGCSPRSGCRQERDPDRRVRQGERRAGHGLDRCDAARRRGSACGRS